MGSTEGGCKVTDYWSNSNYECQCKPGYKFEGKTKATDATTCVKEESRQVKTLKYQNRKKDYEILALKTKLAFILQEIEDKKVDIDIDEIDAKTSKFIQMFSNMKK